MYITLNFVYNFNNKCPFFTNKQLFIIVYQPHTIMCSISVHHLPFFIPHSSFCILHFSLIYYYFYPRITIQQTFIALIQNDKFYTPGISIRPVYTCHTGHTTLVQLQKIQKSIFQ